MLRQREPRLWCGASLPSEGDSAPLRDLAASVWWRGGIAPALRCRRKAASLCLTNPYPLPLSPHGGKGYILGRACGPAPAGALVRAALRAHSRRTNFIQIAQNKAFRICNVLLPLKATTVLWSWLLQPHKGRSCCPGTLPCKASPLQHSQSAVPGFAPASQAIRCAKHRRSQVRLPQRKGCRGEAPAVRTPFSCRRREKGAGG